MMLGASGKPLALRLTQHAARHATVEFTTVLRTKRVGNRIKYQHRRLETAAFVERQRYLGKLLRLKVKGGSKRVVSQIDPVEAQ